MLSLRASQRYYLMWCGPNLLREWIKVDKKQNLKGSTVGGIAEPARLRAR